MTGAWVQNDAQQKRKFTTYERGADNRDEAMHRGYSAWASRFDQPDPYDGSYDLTDPQSLNRYAYVGNDPVNFVDPSGLLRYIEKPWAGIDPLFLRFLFFTPGGGGTGGDGEGGGGGGQSSALADKAAKDADKRKEEADCIRRSWNAHVNRVLNKFGGLSGYAAKLYGVDKIPEDIAESLGETGIVIGAVGGDSVVRRGSSITHSLRSAGRRVGTGRAFVGALVVNRTISQYQNIYDVSKVVIPSFNQHLDEIKKCTGN